MYYNEENFKFRPNWFFIILALVGLFLSSYLFMNALKASNQQKELKIWWSQKVQDVDSINEKVDPTRPIHIIGKIRTKEVDLMPYNPDDKCIWWKYKTYYHWSETDSNGNTVNHSELYKQGTSSNQLIFEKAKITPESVQVHPSLLQAKEIKTPASQPNTYYRTISSCLANKQNVSLSGYVLLPNTDQKVVIGKEVKIFPAKSSKDQVKSIEKDNNIILNKMLLCIFAIILSLIILFLGIYQYQKNKGYTYGNE